MLSINFIVVLAYICIQFYLSTCNASVANAAMRLQVCIIAKLRLYDNF